MVVFMLRGVIGVDVFMLLFLLGCCWVCGDVVGVFVV